MKRRALILWGLGGLATTALGLRRIEPPAKYDVLAQAELTESNLLFRFVALGDVGTGEAEQYSVAKAMEQRYQTAPFPFALLNGDNIYPEGEIERISESFEQPYAALLQNGVKFRAVLGNHDFSTRQGEDEVAYLGYNMPERYYTFTEKSVQFFALDTNQIYLDRRFKETPWNAQLDWLQKELEGSTAPWKVVFAHHPIYSSGSHGSDRRLKRALSPLFAKYGVQIYTNGHDHNYERTEPIDGTTYITSGNGAKLRPVGRSRWTAHASSQLGFTAFDVYTDRIVIKAIDTDSRSYDEAQIVKS